jgi:hypothetical protein
MISGVMPSHRQTFHMCVAGFVYSVFSGAALVNAQILLPTHRPPADTLMQVVAVLFIVLAIGIIVLQTWFRRRVIRQFRYDGTTLHYITLGSTQTQSRLPSQLVAIREWAGRGTLVGYQLIFKDHPKAYLEADTSNTSKLIESLLKDMPHPGLRP